jgi:hypothetical protein
MGMCVGCAQPLTLPSCLNAMCQCVVWQATHPWMLCMQVNCGAAVTRNRLLDDSYGDLCIMWDDDVHPLPGCLDAYTQAFRAHPDVAGFTGADTFGSAIDAPAEHSLWLGKAVRYEQQ